jgi:hypothetical protein
MKAIPVLFFIGKVSVNRLYCFCSPNFLDLKRYNYFYAESFVLLRLSCFKTFILKWRSDRQILSEDRYRKIGIGRPDIRNFPPLYVTQGSLGSNCKFYRESWLTAQNDTGSLLNIINIYPQIGSKLERSQILSQDPVGSFFIKEKTTLRIL